MIDASLLREKSYPYDIVFDFEQTQLLRCFMLHLPENKCALAFICDENLGVTETLLDVPALEKLLASELMVYEPDEMVNGLSLAAKNNLQCVILDESSCDRELIYLRTTDPNSVLAVQKDTLQKVLSDLGFEPDAESGKPKLIIHDFGHTVSKQTKYQKVVSGIQPSGDLTIGNYLGAIINWKRLINKYDENYFFLADLHSLTTLPNPADLRDRIRKTVMTLIACGLDLEKAVLFRQSQLGGYHTELAWIFSCLAPDGRLEQMIQFKEKSQQQQTVGTGLKIYPILQAADISLYQGTLVPIGNDQRQHLELTREIVRKFNNCYGYTLPIPKAELPEVTARVMSLADGTKKMSKSDINSDSCIYILDPPDEISRKIRRAKTDSEPTLEFDQHRPEIFNLLSIYQVLSGEKPETIEAKFEGKGAAGLKSELTELLVESLRPIREKYNVLASDASQVDAVLKKGKDMVEPIAKQTLAAVKEQVGL